MEIAQVPISQADAASKHLAVEDWSPCPAKAPAEDRQLNKDPSVPEAHQSSSTEDSTESDSEKDAAEVFVSGKSRKSPEQASGPLSSAQLKATKPNHLQLMCTLCATLI